MEANKLPMSALQDIHSTRRFYLNLFRMRILFESSEKIRKNNMLDSTVRTKNLILELISTENV